MLLQAFNSLYWDFCFASLRNVIDVMTSARNSFNSLYWDFCFASKARPTTRHPHLPRFQFPLLGFLLCIEICSATGFQLNGSFNSLYWDFCFASKTFWQVWSESKSLSIPFIGIFALHRQEEAFHSNFHLKLSIPFIGIFALHRMVLKATRRRQPRAFNSLYWDFCFASC